MTETETETGPVSSLAPGESGDRAISESQRRLQAQLLDAVSRTFALTIPQLPPALTDVVGNAYLLCRIADTVEDEPRLTGPAKRAFLQRLNAVLEDDDSEPVLRFARDLGAELSDRTPLAEHELIAQSPEVIAIFRSFGAAEQAALRRCVRVMGEGMGEFQGGRPQGLHDVVVLERYCYYVAGVVGEMLTELFCAYSPQLAARRDVMLRLAVPFGIGLQLTNILKDVWDDRQRGACWLPVSLFGTANDRRRFDAGLTQLIGLARRHLHDALRYTLLVPRQETGIRHFCLRALGMALLTLRKVHRRRHYRSGEEVKISRKAVKAVLLLSSVSARNDPLLRVLFGAASAGLPAAAAYKD